jgi:hypothetical protein
MHTRKLVAAALTCALALALAATRQASSQTGGQYDLTWNTINGGGITFASGGAYQLGSTLGAPDVGKLGGGNYTLGAGFWGGSPLVPTEGQETVYLPMFRRLTL